MEDQPCDLRAKTQGNITSIKRKKQAKIDFPAYNLICH